MENDSLENHSPIDPETVDTGEVKLVDDLQKKKDTELLGK